LKETEDLLNEKQNLINDLGKKEDKHKNQISRAE